MHLVLPGLSNVCGFDLLEEYTKDAGEKCYESEEGNLLEIVRSTACIGCKKQWWSMMVGMFRCGFMLYRTSMVSNSSLGIARPQSNIKFFQRML